MLIAVSDTTLERFLCIYSQGIVSSGWCIHIMTNFFRDPFSGGFLLPYLLSDDWHDMLMLMHQIPWFTFTFSWVIRESSPKTEGFLSTAGDSTSQNQRASRVFQLQSIAENHCLLLKPLESCAPSTFTVNFVIFSPNSFLEHSLVIPPTAPKLGGPQEFPPNRFPNGFSNRSCR